LELNYQEVVQKLKEGFPQGTVKFRSDNNRAYIPNQVYTDRVERATNSQWDLTIKEIEINVPHRYIKVIVTVTIGPHHRDGYGFSVIEKDAAGEPIRLANALDQAANEAVKTALDTWQMGWSTLAPFYKEDWGGNPALRHLLVSDPPPEPGDSFPVVPNAKIDRFCIFSNCGKQLTHDEWELLGQIPRFNRNKMTYCYEHLPNFWKRKIPEDVRKDFENRRNG
jgi:hypothetical protein